MIINEINRNLSKMKKKILQTCLTGNFGDSLGELSIMRPMVCLGRRGLNDFTVLFVHVT